MNIGFLFRPWLYPFMTPSVGLAEGMGNLSLMDSAPPRCQGHSTLSSQCVFEGAQLTQLVQLVTAGRLFLGHKRRVDPYMDECLYHYVCFGHEGFLLQVSLQVAAMALSGRRTDVMQRVLRILSRLDLKHEECRRARC